VVLALIHMLNAQIARANRYHLRDALCNPSHLQPRNMRQRNAHAVVRGEALYLDARKLRRVCVRNNRDTAVGENAVNVEQQYLDPARARGQCRFNHSLMIQARKTTTASSLPLAVDRRRSVSG